MSEEKKYFVIEKSVYSYDKDPHFDIMKDKAFNLTEATKMLIAYEQLNDDKEQKTYHLQLVDLWNDSKKSTLEKEEQEDDRIPF